MRLRDAFQHRSAGKSQHGAPLRYEVQLSKDRTIALRLLSRSQPKPAVPAASTRAEAFRRKPCQAQLFELRSVSPHSVVRYPRTSAGGENTAICKLMPAMQKHPLQQFIGNRFNPHTDLQIKIRHARHIRKIRNKLALSLESKRNERLRACFFSVPFDASRSRQPSVNGLAAAEASIGRVRRPTTQVCTITQAARNHCYNTYHNTTRFCSRHTKYPRLRDSSPRTTFYCGPFEGWLRRRPPPMTLQIHEPPAPVPAPVSLTIPFSSHFHVS